MTHRLQVRQAAGPRQTGVALITALLVVALATVAAVTVAGRQEIDIRRTSNLLEADQAYAYALGVETWAGLILERDAAESDRDYLGEDWATVLPPIAVEGGQVAGYIEDLQGRFNLNNLIQGANQSAAHVQQFQRLLQVLDLPPELATALLDWMDADIDSRFPDGAEDDAYLGGELPYRTANQPLVSITELRLVKGFDADAMALLAPHVAVLQSGTKINVNTATVPVLRSLADDISQADAENLVEGRGEEGYGNVGEFLQHSALAGRKVAQSGLSITSDHFLVHGVVDVGNARTWLYSTIRREQEGSRVLVRTQGSE